MPLRTVVSIIAKKFTIFLVIMYTSSNIQPDLLLIDILGAYLDIFVSTALVHSPFM